MQKTFSSIYLLPVLVFIFLPSSIAMLIFLTKSFVGLDIFLVIEFFAAFFVIRKSWGQLQNTFRIESIFLGIFCFTTIAVFVLEPIFSYSKKILYRRPSSLGLWRSVVF